LLHCAWSAPSKRRRNSGDRYSSDPLPMMTRRLARKNIRTGLIVAAICMLMFGLTFVIAAIYVS
jgi:hypothetical protein